MLDELVDIDTMVAPLVPVADDVGAGGASGEEKEIWAELRAARASGPDEADLVPISGRWHPPYR